MTPHRFNSSLFRRVLILLSCAVVAHCNITLPPQSFKDPPLFTRINAKVGVHYPGPARTYTYISPLFRVKFGQISVSRFDQIFASMFSEIVPVPDWPPWRESGLNVDAVIELREVELEIDLGNDLDQPDLYSVGYQICLLKPDATVLNCWSPECTQRYQRKPFECLDLSLCARKYLEGAVRDTSARFMLEFQQDPVVHEWANSLLTETSD